MQANSLARFLLFVLTVAVTVFVVECNSNPGISPLHRVPSKESGQLESTRPSHRKRKLPRKKCSKIDSDSRNHAVGSLDGAAVVAGSISGRRGHATQRKAALAVEAVCAVNADTSAIAEARKSYIFCQMNEKKGKLELTYYGLMLSGAVARSVSATAVHPLNVMKTMLQTRNGKMPELKWSVLSRGAGSQFIMSVPHGAVNFAVTETTKKVLAELNSNSTLSRVLPTHVLNPLLDFTSSAVSTFLCSSISTPQMVLTDRIMAGVYTNFFDALITIAKTEGIEGFYRGWLPAIVQKIPSYALTWMFFQQLKALFLRLMDRAGTTLENTLLGSVAAAGACCVMIPVDTVKTRIVTQRPGTEVYYSGMTDCFIKILRQEGVWSFYKSLPPRLLSVVPMIGIQFGVYELMKRLLLQDPPPKLSSKLKATTTAAAGAHAANAAHTMRADDAAAAITTVK